MRKIAIIAAGGMGKRMGGTIPKQFMSIGGVPVLIRTLQRLYNYDANMRFVMVLPPDTINAWHQLNLQYTPPRGTHEIVVGGSERFFSIQNAVKYLAANGTSANDLVAVHDAVRPFVTTDVVAHCFETAARSGTAIPVIPLTDSVRLVDESGSHPMDRSTLRLVQTPQVFRFDWLYEAYTQPFNQHFTDDASAVEACGHTINLVDGNRDNIKLTTPFDLTIAEALLHSTK